MGGHAERMTGLALGVESCERARLGLFRGGEGGVSLKRLSVWGGGVVRMGRREELVPRTSRRSFSLSERRLPFLPGDGSPCPCL